MILTPDQFKEYLTEDVPHSDDVLKVMLDANEAAIIRWAGPMGVSTEAHRVYGMTMITLKQPARSITLVTDTFGSTDTELEAEDYLVDGRTVYRLGGFFWGNRTTVEYISDASAAEYIMTLVKLMQCDLNHQPGMSSQSAGPWQESYSGNHQDERQAILELLRPAAVFA
jgi:hypothetical protein